MTVPRRTSFMAGIVLAGSLAFPALAQTMPDPSLTPGVVASTDTAEVCGYVDGLSYSRRHRATTLEMKREVRRRYGITGYWRGEIDHRAPLCVGGADVVENLWPQADFQAKDELEAQVCRAVCHGQMTLQQGQAIFLGDWRGHLSEKRGGQ